MQNFCYIVKTCDDRNAKLFRNKFNAPPHVAQCEVEIWINCGKADEEPNLKHEAKIVIELVD